MIDADLESDNEKSVPEQTTQNSVKSHTHRKFRPSTNKKTGSTLTVEPVKDLSCVYSVPWLPGNFNLKSGKVKSFNFSFFRYGNGTFFLWTIQGFVMDLDLVLTRCNLSKAEGTVGTG